MGDRHSSRPVEFATGHFLGFPGGDRDVDDAVVPIAKVIRSAIPPLPLSAVVGGTGTEHDSAWRPWCTSPGPTITVPCGFDVAGLLIAMQISAPAGREELVLRAAVAYLSTTDWHRTSPDLAGESA